MNIQIIIADAPKIETSKNDEKEGKALIIAPDDTCGVTTTKHRKEDVDRMYEKGYQTASLIKTFIM